MHKVYLDTLAIRVEEPCKFVNLGRDLLVRDDTAGQQFRLEPADVIYRSID